MQHSVHVELLYRDISSNLIMVEHLQVARVQTRGVAVVLLSQLPCSMILWSGVSLVSVRSWIPHGSFVKLSRFSSAR
jgi:hypothetical protein